MTFAVLLHFTFNAHAFYDPHVGRFINRDPIGEAGFAVTRQVPAVSEANLRVNEGNLYRMLLNDTINHIDALGLIKFEGCGDKEGMIQRGLQTYCEKIKSPEFKCCLGHFNIPARLKGMCENSANITIKCESADSGRCGGACAWSLPGGSTIHLCPQQWSNMGCGPVGCTLLHELTHMIGHGFEKWPTKVENCLGCK